MEWGLLTEGCGRRSGQSIGSGSQANRPRGRCKRFPAAVELVKVAKNYLSKGSKVYLEGQLQTRKWTDKDGQEKYSTEIVLQGFNSSLVMLNKVERNGEEESEKPAPSSQASASTSLMDDEIQF